MAGPRVLDAPSALAERQRMPALSRHHAIDASVTLLGKRFTTAIREGASAEELIEKVARENGGGVAKVYYPEFKTWEIVAVRAGDVFLVKGDPKKVAEADFSNFPDAAAVRRRAMAVASHSDGGIHFSLGQSGIPLALTAEQGIVFPNAEELRVRKETSSIALWMTSANANPLELKDLERAYSASGGIRVSDDAQRQLASAHGGVRSEKLLLHDNLLVLDKESGEIRTASEYADRIRVEGFAAPQFRTPDYTSVGLAMPSEKGVIVAPMDASPFRIPYLFVKVFDGRLADHVSVQFNLIKECVQPAARRGAAGRMQNASSSSRAFQARMQPAEAGSQESESAGRQTASASVPASARADAPRSERASTNHAQFQAPMHAPGHPFPQHLPPSMKIAPETIMKSWLGTRLPPLRFVIPGTLRPTPPRRMRQSPTRRSVPASIPEKKAGARRLPAAPSSDSVHGAKKKKRKPKPNKHARAPAEEQARAAPKPKIVAQALPLKKRKRETTNNPEVSVPKTRLRAMPSKIRPHTAELLPKTAKTQNQEPKNRRKKSRAAAYFMMELLGLLPQCKRRGRKFNMKKSSAV